MKWSGKSPALEDRAARLLQVEKQMNRADACTCLMLVALVTTVITAFAWLLWR